MLCGAGAGPRGSDVDRRSQCRRAGTGVDDGAAGEVDGVQPSRPEKPAAPDPVGQRAVDEQRPQGDEDEVAGESHPFGDGAGDQAPE